MPPSGARNIAKCQVKCPHWAATRMRWATHAIAILTARTSEPRFASGLCGGPRDSIFGCPDRACRCAFAPPPPHEIGATLLDANCNEICLESSAAGPTATAGRSSNGDAEKLARPVGGGAVAEQCAASDLRNMQTRATNHVKSRSAFFCNDVRRRYTRARELWAVTRKVTRGWSPSFSGPSALWRLS